MASAPGAGPSSRGLAGPGAAKYGRGAGQADVSGVSEDDDIGDEDYDEDDDDEVEFYAGFCPSCNFSVSERRIS